ncbi:hypothetical protein MSG28_010498, partial [Choristoneura fumiferana]
RRNFCFYLDIQEHGLARTISRRLQDMGFQQEVFLTSRVTHVVRESRVRDARWRREPGRARADAMLERVRRTPQHHNYAIALLDKLYDTFCTAPRKSNVRLFSKHFIKIEFLDKQCRPLYKEFDTWPEISLEPNPPKDKKEKREILQPGAAVNNNHQNTTQDREKNRPRIKEKEDKEPRGGYCEACGTDYTELAAHARSPRHAAFRRSLRNMCNGDAALNGSPSPRARNGALDDDRRPNTRCRKTTDASEDRQYYKVVGVSTKLRSSGGFVPKRADSSPTCNGTKPLVVKFRKVRRSELSVLSDEAEQFMFPKRASSTSSTSSESDDEEPQEPRRKTPPQPAPALERRRHARPLALKEESSEEDSWLDDKRRRKRKVAPAVRRTRRAPVRPPTPEPAPPPEPEPEPEPETPVPPPPEPEVVSPLREEPVQQCMKWEDGKLKYTPAVEQLEFAFECVPRSEPWAGRRGLRRRRRGGGGSRRDARAARHARPAHAQATRAPRRRAAPATLAARARLHARHPRLAPPARRRQVHRLRRHRQRARRALRRLRPRPRPGPALETDERLRQFLSEVYEDADFDALEPDPLHGAALPTSTAAPDVLDLVSDCDRCDIIRHHIRDAAAQRRATRRGRFKKKNRTGWPNKRKHKKGARADSSDHKTESSLDRSSVASADTRDSGDLSGDDDKPARGGKLDDDDESRDEPMDVDRPDADDRSNSDDKPLRLNVKVLLEDKKAEKAKAEKVKGSSSVSESDEKEERVKKKKRALNNLGSWLQPVVRVARVDPAAARRLRSAGAGARSRLR